MKYWLQTKAPAGNWVDSVGSADKDICIRHGKWLLEPGQEYHQVKEVRVVIRKDTEIWGSSKS